ncbi:MAG: DUF4838 domain-containing protein [Pigmentiphaga sp.]|nr:DUF4838 domain-containing protein [Pigmentiphaga sp.]
MNNSFKILVIFLVFNTANIKAEVKLLLASEGKANYTIKLSENADITERFAANELKENFEIITKSSFKISSKHSSEKCIFIGQKDVISKHLENINIEKLKLTDSFAILEKSENIYLIGNNPIAVLYAVYKFLELNACRWVAPDFDFYNSTNKFIPATSKLYYNHKDIYEEPSFKYRKFYIEEARSHTTKTIKQIVDWMPKAKMNTLVFPINYEGRNEVMWKNWREELIPELQKRNILIEVGGHGYQNFLNSSMENGKLFEIHPEWFGLNTNGERSDDLKMVFCTSNQAAVNYLYQNIKKYLKENSEIDIFDFWPPDSGKWCNCDNCKKLGDISDRHTILVNNIAERLQKDLPDIILECIAYSHYSSPSSKIKLNKNVLVDFCPIHQNFETQIYEDLHPINKEYFKDIKLWIDNFDGDLGIYSYYRKYAWRSLPNIILNYMKNDIKEYNSLKIKSISIYSEPGDWFTYGINHYVFSNLAWNVNVNIDSLKTVYTQNIFGAKHQIVDLLYTELEDIIRFSCKIANSEMKTIEEYSKYLHRINKLQKYLSDEINLMNDSYKTNFEKLNLNLEYAAKSINFMIAKAAKDKNLENKLDLEIKNYLKEHKDKGIFIPYRNI